MRGGGVGRVFEVEIEILVVIRGGGVGMRVLGLARGRTGSTSQLKFGRRRGKEA